MSNVEVPSIHEEFLDDDNDDDDIDGIDRPYVKWTQIFTALRMWFIKSIKLLKS